MGVELLGFGGLESIKLDEGSATPLYIQIAEGLIALLKGSIFPPSSPLPPERVLCKVFGVSRMTVRQAMSIVWREGLIVSHRGRGTFVVHNRLQKRQQELRGFTEEMRARGCATESRVISFKLLAPTPSAYEFFGLAEVQSVYEICRLRFGDGVPLVVETVQIPQRMCPGLDRFDLARNSLYEILEESYGLRLGTSIEEISAEAPSPAHRKLLGLPKNTPVLVVNRKTFTDAGQALELTRSVYRGDLYSSVVHSVRSNEKIRRSRGGVVGYEDQIYAGSSRKE